MRADSEAIYVELLQHRKKDQSRQRDADDFDEVWDAIEADIAKMRQFDPDVVFASPDEDDEPD